MRYVYVENGIVASENRYLPINWNNISNFNLLDTDTLIQYGWYPYEYRRVETRPVNWKPIGSYFEITDKLVIEHELVAEKTDEELKEDELNEWVNIRSARENYLKDSDWTQLTDSPLTVEKKEEWKIYRQALRDITKYENPWIVVWPNQPN